MNLEKLVSHRFTQMKTDKLLCYARLVFIPIGVAEN